MFAAVILCTIKIYEFHTWLSFRVVSVSGTICKAGSGSGLKKSLRILNSGSIFSVIAHGAGGSGKTFTLAGPDLTPALNEEQFGVLPRSSNLL
jgi:hypothetical protein